ncbi:MAG: ABC transporter permease [Lachnospiraceae bacterium]|nr:ABC transporter permease [Lachnospiraceae bacterium]
MKNYKELGNKYIKHRKKRAVLVVLSMVLATMLLYTVSTLLLNFWNDTKEIEETYNNYHVELYELNKEQRDKVSNYVTVRNADFAYVDTETAFEDYYGNSVNFIYYFDNMDQTTFNFKIIEGTLPTSPDEILVRKDNLHKFKDDIKVGSVLKTVVYDEEGNSTPGKSFTVSGIIDYDCVNDLEVYNSIFYSLGTDDMNMSAFIRFDKRGDWNKLAYNLAKDVGVDVSKNQIYYINEAIGTYYLNPNSQGTSYAAMFLMVMLFVGYIAMVMVRGLFTANLFDNVREFSILKAMGATDKKIKNIFKREIYTEGLIAFVIGVVLSEIVFFILEHVVYVYGFNFDFSLSGFIVGFLFLYLTITLAIIEPLSVLKKVPIVEGIKSNYAINNAKDKKRGGKLFRIFGVEGEYAYKNIRRNSKGFWNGVATFAVSVLLITALITGGANIAEMIRFEAGGIDIELAYDYWTSSVPVDDQHTIDKWQDVLLSKDFIEAADPDYSYLTFGKDGEAVIRFTEEAKLGMEIAGWGPSEDVMSVILYTDEQLEKLDKYMLDGISAMELKQGGAIICSGYTYYDEKTEDNITVPLYEAKVGDKVDIINPKFVEDKSSQLELKDEATAQHYMQVEIKGMCSQPLSYGGIGTLIMSYDYVVKEFGLDSSKFFDGFSIKADESFEITDMPALETAIYEETKQTDYMLMNEAMWLDAEMGSMKVIVACIAGFLLLMGIISVLNNMINEQQVRRQEVSILRAVGMSKKKLNKMLILEKVIMGFFAWIIGTVLGVLFVRVLLIGVLYMAEASMVYSIGGYLVTGVAVIAIMVLMSMITVVSMGKMDITEGIRNAE